MSEKALRYRAQRRALDRDEQMSLLVQRVSGGCHGSLFFPQVAGVALCATPTSGASRSIRRRAWCGWCLGWAPARWTAADDDYTRIVALNAPERPAGERFRRGPRVLASERST